MQTLLSDGFIKRKMKIFENIITFRIPNSNEKVILFINGRQDKGIFEKITFHTTKKKISYCPIVYKGFFPGINLKRYPGVFFQKSYKECRVLGTIAVVGVIIDLSLCFIF